MEIHKMTKPQLRQLIREEIKESWRGVTSSESNYYRIYMNGDMGKWYGGSRMSKNEAIRTAKEFARTNDKVIVTHEDSLKPIWSNEQQPVNN